LLGGCRRGALAREAGVVAVPRSRQLAVPIVGRAATAHRARLRDRVDPRDVTATDAAGSSDPAAGPSGSTGTDRRSPLRRRRRVPGCSPGPSRGALPARPPGPTWG